MRKLLHFFWLFMLVSASYSYGQTLRPKILDANGTINAIVQSGDTVYLGGSFTQVGFNTGGAAKLTTNSAIPNHDFPKVSGQVTKVIADGSGGWYLGGSFSYTVDGQQRLYLAHVLPDGSFDAAFNPQPNSYIDKMILSGSTLYVMGSFTQIGGQARRYLAALSASTGQANGFDPQPNSTVEDMALSGSTLYVGGSFTRIGGREQRYFAPLSTATGQATQTLDFNSTVNSLATDGNTLYLGGSFSQIGYFTGSLAKLTTGSAVPNRDFPKVSGQVTKVIADGSGGWYLGGSFSYTVDGQQRLYLAHVLADGSFDAAFNPQPNSYIDKMILSGSTLYVMGSFTQIGGQARRYLAALSASTGQANGFDPQPNSTVEDMALSGSTLYVGGSFTRIGGREQRYFAPLSTATGQATQTLDFNSTVNSLATDGNTLYLGGSFSQIGYFTGSLAKLTTGSAVPNRDFPKVSGQVTKVIADGSGGWYLGGSFSYTVDGQQRLYLAHVLADGSFDAAFNPQPNSYIDKMILSGSTLYVMGSFTQIGGQARRYLAALSASTGQANGFDPQPNSTVEDMALSGSTLYVGGSFAQIGGLSRNYLAAVSTSTGQATSFNPTINSTVTSLAVDGSTLYLGGGFSQVNGQERRYLAGLSVSTGALTAFNPAPNSTVNMLLLSGSTLYAAGSFTQIGGQSRTQLAALSTATGQATSFNPQPNSRVYDVALSGSTLYAAGTFTQIGGQNRRYLAALNASTGEASGWAPEPNGAAYSVAVSGTDVLAGGGFSFLQTQERRYLAGWSVSTGALTAFNPAPNSTVNMLLLSGSTLYAAGSFTQIGGQSRTQLAALSTATGQATSFNPQPNSRVYDVALSGSTLYAAGTFTQIGGQNRRYLAALNASTGEASGWMPEPNGSAYAVAVSGTDVLAGGGFSFLQTQERRYLAGWSVSTGALTAFNPAPNSTVNMLLLSGSTLYAAGSFTQIGGQSRTQLAALSTATGQATSFNPQPNSRVYDVALSGSTLYAAGTFTQIGGQNRRYLAALNASTGEASGWMPEPNGSAYAVAVSGTDVLAGGGFSFLQAQDRRYLAAYKASTGELLPWNPAANSTVETMALSGSTLFVGGSFTQLGGLPRTRLGAINRITGVVTAWDPSANSTVQTLVVDGDLVYVGGSFTNIGGQSRNYLASINRNANAATSWNPSANGIVHALAVNNSTVYAGGSFSQMGGQDRRYIAAFDKANGNLTSWNPSANNVVHALKLEGSLVYAGGSFTNIGGQTRSYIAALSMANGQATAWNPRLNSTVLTLDKSQDYVFAGGNFTRVGEQPVSYFAMLDAGTGAALGTYPQFSSYLNALHYNLASRTLYTGGQFTSVNNKNRNYFATFEVRPTTTVSDQVITFNTISAKTLADDPLKLVATASSGLPVTFTVLSGPATVSGDQVSFTGIGTVVIRASQAGNEEYNPAPVVDRSFNVTKATQTITLANIPNKTLGDPAFAVTATASSGLPVSLAVFSGPATISGNVVTLTGTGTVTVEATQAGDETYNAATAIRRSFTVSAPTLEPQSITFAAIPDKTFGDAPFTLSATASSGLTVSFQVISGPATVSGNTLTITGAGSVTVRATQSGNGTYAAASPVDRTFTVGKASQTITFAAISEKTLGDAPFTLSASASSGLPVAFAVVSGPATVTGNTITLTGVGTVVVRASQEGSANYNAAASVDRSFEVKAAPKQNQTITFAALGEKTFGDAPFTLAASASSGLTVGFSVVSGPATIAGNTLTITGAGTVVVEATQAGNEVYNAAPAVRQSLTVNKASQNIIAPFLSTMTYGDGPVTLDAIASSGLPVSYVLVSGPGTIAGNRLTATGAGTIVIRYTQAGNANYLAAEPLERSVTVRKAPQDISFAALPDRTYGDAPFTLAASASSGLPVSFTVVSGPATISGNTVTLTGTGTVSIRASQAGNTNYEAAESVVRSFSVLTPDKQNQTITFAALPAKTFGDGPVTLSATASSGLPVSFSLVSGPATLVGNTLTLTGAGTVIVQALQPGNETYNAATPVQRSFVVNKASQSITFNAIPNKTLGDPAFAVSATATSGLPVSYSIVSGPATIAGNVITLTGTGTVVVEATQGGNDDYLAATAVRRSFTVSSPTLEPQSITFTAIPDKTFGDAPFMLSATASSGLPVSFQVISGPATVSGNTLTITGAGNVTVRATQAGNGTYAAAAPVDRTFTVNKASQTVTFAAIPDRTLGDAPFTLSATASSGLPVAYMVVSGPASLSGNTVTLTGVGTVVLRASQAGNANYNAATPVERSFEVKEQPTTPVACTNTGSLSWELWNLAPNITEVYNFPVNTVPASKGTITSFATPANIGDNYGIRVRGYICAPVSGEYTFYLSGDDRAELYLSSDMNPMNKQRIAFIRAATKPGEFDKFDSQMSAKITLQAGQRYYIESRLREFRFADHMTVAWQLPNGTMESPIAGSHLIPFEQAEVAGILWEYLLKLPSDFRLPSNGEMPEGVTPSGSRILESFESPSNFGNQYGARARGYVIPPASGMYTFRLSADDQAELWLSTDNTVANRQLIAEVNNWTRSREYGKYPSQTSGAVYLQAGQRYYIETLHIEFWGRDNLSVGWSMAGGMSENVISGQYLRPLKPEMQLVNQHALTGTDLNAFATEANKLTAYPNPFSDKVTLEFFLEEKGEVRLDVFNVKGELLETMVNGTVEPGKVYRYVFNGTPYANGVYICRLTSNGKVEHKRIVLSK